MKHASNLACVVTLGLTLAACGSEALPTAGSSTASVPASAPATTVAAPPATAAPATAAPVPIRVFALEQPGMKLSTNSFSKELERRFNIHFDWQTAPWDAATSKQKRDLSLASGDYPDIYLVHWRDTFSQQEVIQYGQQGVFLPLNDLIDQYAPNIKAVLEQNPNYKAQSTAPDGKIYGLPQLNECYHCSYPNKLWINSTWLKKLGLKQPTTPEEFKTVLEAFKTRDPNGNGKADEIPLSGSTENIATRLLPYFMNSFVYDDNYTYIEMDGQNAGFAANKPEWKAGLDYLKSLYDAGLLDPNTFTQKGDALKKMASGTDAALVGASTALHPAEIVPLEQPRNYEYDAVPPLHGLHDYAVYNYPVQGVGFVLTRKASPQVQVAAIKMLDYLFTTDGQIRGYFGEEGKDWRKPQPGDVALNPAVPPLYVNTSIQNAGGDVGNRAWGPIAQYYNPRAYRDAEVQSIDTHSFEGFERRLQEATKLYDGKQPASVFPHWAIWFNPAVSSEATQLRTSVSEYVEQNAVLFITGEKNLDTDWEAYVAGFEQLRLQRYLELMQQAYAASAQR